MDTTQKDREKVRRRPAGEGQNAPVAARRKRPGEASPRRSDTRREEAPRQRTASQRPSRREEGVRYSAPQGTGPLARAKTILRLKEQA